MDLRIAIGKAKKGPPLPDIYLMTEEADKILRDETFRRVIFKDNDSLVASISDYYPKLVVCIVTLNKVFIMYKKDSKFCVDTYLEPDRN